jgi:chaperone modulatory protein CbpM
MQPHEFFRHAPLDHEVLDQWVEAGWLSPHQNSTGQRFSDVDLARAHLIRDLQELGVNDDSIPIVHSLVDQLHGLRYLLRELLVMMKAQRQEQDRA